MIHRSIRASVVLNALVFALGCGIALGQIADPKCADKANNFAAKVSSTQNKENRSCVKNQGKGKLQTTVEACLTADAKQKVQKKKDKVSGLFATGGACEGDEATDLVTDAATINGAHVNASTDLIHDIFGADLDADRSRRTRTTPSARTSSRSAPGSSSTPGSRSSAAARRRR